MKRFNLTFIVLAIAIGSIACMGAASNSADAKSTNAAPTDDKKTEIENNTTSATTSVAMEDKAKDKMDEGLYAKINTDKGSILIKLEFERTPVTVANFVGLAEGKIPNKAKADGVPYYDGLIFHRVIANFMIQGGDPDGRGSGGPGYKFQDEFDGTLVHDRAGTLSMANAGPHTNGSQIFITHGPTPHLNGKHTVFGYVVTGQEVVDAIRKDDVINTVEIIRVGKAASAFDAAATFKELAKLK